MPTSAFILTWNRQKFPWENYDHLVKRTKNGKTVAEGWNTQNKGIVEGDRLFLLRQGEVKGLIGTGWAASGCYLDENYDSSLKRKQVWYVRACFDTLLREDEVLPTETLIESIIAVDWRYIRGSGRSVPSKSLKSLEELWQSHLEHVEYLSPDEVGPVRHLKEGAIRQSVVDAYERNPAARRKCIEYYGTTCVVCGFDFQKAYGELGKGFTHVHHLRDLSTVGEEYEVDPINDMRPICPNCHAMLHRNRKVPAIRIEELRGHLQK